MEKLKISRLNWQTILIVVVVVSVIVIIAVIILNNKQIPEEVPETNKEVKEFLQNETRKLRNVKLTREEFDNLKVPDNFTLYYFPNECPGYTEDILLYENTKFGERYYLPEQYSLIKLLPDHHWTNEFTGELFKSTKSSELLNFDNSNEQRTPIQECSELSSE